jgi:menaquinone-specific isochorismate synthase
MISATSCLHTTARDVDLPDGLVDLLPHLNPSGTWIREGEGLIGLGVAASTTATGAGRFKELAAYWESLLRSPSPLDPAGPVALVSVAFSGESESPSRLLVPEVLIRCEGGRTTLLVTTPHPEPAAQVLERHGLRLDDGGLLRPTGPAPAEAMPECRLRPGVQSERQYLSAIAAGLSAVHEGTVDKLVLARDVVVTASAPLPSGKLLARLATEYPQTWIYCVGGIPSASHTLLGATPEMLVRLRGHQLSSRVLAGTIDRAQHTADLVRDAKQHREHELAVTSLLEQLRPVAEDLQAPSEPSVLALPNVYHLASDITGKLSADASGRFPAPLQVAEAAHPTAAVCGTPTTTAADLIAQLEEMDRGPYAGPVGWIDAAGNADFGIALRGGVFEGEVTPAGGDTLRIFAGCGVVAGSEPESELAETRIKLKPMLWALGLDL